MTSVSKMSETSNSQAFPYRFFIRLGLVLIYVLVTAVSGYVVYERVRQQVAQSDLLPDFTMDRSNPDTSSNVERVAGETLPVWTGIDRVTVLILGIDERQQEDEDYWRTDTMILATLDPVTMQAGVLSIPRDLWVPIPGYTENRINTAHALGDYYEYPGGGPALAVETVRYNLGIEKIDYYVRVNFQAFIDMVDMIGGIDIEVPESIDDPCYPTSNYGCEHLQIEAGPHHFDGDMALKYARVRHTAGGDFDRARRQQQVIEAVMEQVTDSGMVPQLAARAPEMWATLDDSVKLDPDLQLDEIIALAHLATKLDLDADVRFRAIDETCTYPAETPDGAQILIPLRDQIRDVRDEIFGLTDAPVTASSSEEEKATVAVLNGTAASGLAYATAQYLEANDMLISDYDNADRQDYDTSLIILNRDKPMTAQRLLTLLDLPQSVVVNGSNPTAEHDIVVILGSDYTATDQASENE